MIGAACEGAEKIIADARKAYFGTRQGPTHLPTIDKVQAAKIQEQENLLRSAVNHGEGAYLILNSSIVHGDVFPLSIVTITSFAYNLVTHFRTYLLSLICPLC